LGRAGEISQLDPSFQIVLYTFGSPRVGNMDFCRRFDRQVQCTWRIENERVCGPGVPQLEALASS
jgi:hypothetical protein